LERPSLFGKKRPNLVGYDTLGGTNYWMINSCQKEDYTPTAYTVDIAGFLVQYHNKKALN
jgi:hypothetical protein